MRASLARRILGFLGLVVAIGSAAIFAYRVNAEPPFPQPILGVVHQTEIRIAPETSGRLASVRVIPGQQVRRGDVLAVLSTPELTAAAEEAKANAATARADRTNVYAGTRKEEVDIAAQDVSIAEANLLLAQQQQERAATLASRQFASKQQLDESVAALAKAEANLALLKAVYTETQAGPTKEERAIADAKVELAEAAIADLEAKLAKTTLVAPADGVVGLLVTELGEAISPGQPVMTLEVGNERWFTLTIREDRLAGIAIGSRLQFTTARGDHIDARVTELRPLGEFAVWRAARAVGDHDINSFLIRADPVGPAHGLEPGMTVWLDHP